MTSEEEEEKEEGYDDDDTYGEDLVWCDYCGMWSDMSEPFGTCMCS